MTTNALTTTEPTDDIKRLVIDAVTNPHTKRAYDRALTDFIAWYDTNGKPGLNKATVQHYAAQLREQGVSPSSVNQRLSAIRKLAIEASDNGLIPEQISNGIKAVKGIRQEGQRSGNWLTKEQAQSLINAPDISTLKGLRDRAMFAILLGCGLRRQELISLTFEHIQQRDNRWVIADMVGKRNKVRTVPVPAWAKIALDEWTQAANIHTGFVFRALDKGDKLDTTSEQITAQTVYDILLTYIDNIAPHDLRRTFAKLAHKGGAGLDQIQVSLGHSSLVTTQKYLGLELDLSDPACDHVGLKVKRAR